MSTAVRSSRGPRPAADAQAPGAAARWAAVVVGLAAVGLLVAWLLGWLQLGTDPRVAEILKLQDEARQKFEANGGPRTVAEATEAFTAMVAIRGKVEALPERLRPQVQRAGGDMFRSAFRARINEYFDAPPAQKNAVLDRQIDQEEIMRKAFEAGRSMMSVAGGGSRGPGGGGPPGGGPGGSAAGGGPGGGGPGGGGGGPTRGGPPRDGSEEDVNRWRKGMIDRTTPDQRARWVEYRRAMDQRRDERGLPSGWPR
jgi:uncharacterized membrane protein YgcG